jgi:hypothetical protein
LLQYSERIRRIEAFDEYEEWHHKCMHYVIAVGLHGQALSAPFGTISDTFYAPVPASLPPAPLTPDANWLALSAALRKSAPNLY